MANTIIIKKNTSSLFSESVNLAPSNLVNKDLTLARF